MITLVFKIMGLAIMLPLFAGMGVALAVGMILMTPAAAYELAMLVNTAMFFVWLILPASYNSQMFERFEMSRLFTYPISRRGIVVGSTLISLLTATGLWTIPVLLGEIVGFAYHRPAALPLVLIGAVPLFTLLVLSGRIVEDMFDLVSGDRRLRALAIALLTAPMVLCWLGQYAVQYITDNYERLSYLMPAPLRDQITPLREATSVSEFLEILAPSRILAWLPPGWGTAGMGLAATGRWGMAFIMLAFAVVTVAVLLWTHARVTRSLMGGAALSVGAEQVRSRRWSTVRRGSPAFWGLLRKDWIHLWRSPMPRRLIFSSVVIIGAMLVPLRSIEERAGTDPAFALMPVLAFSFAVTMGGMALNMGTTANYFGTFDREGFAILTQTAYDRRYALAAANLVILLYAAAQYLGMALVVVAATGDWTVLSLGLFLGVCLQVGSTPAYNLAAVLGPYRAQLRFSAGTRRRSSLWGMLAWGTSALPILALVVVPYAFWRPGLWITLPVTIAYSVGLYLVTLKPLAGLLQRREHAILEAVTSKD
jgi:hypothetical protein